MQNDMVEFRPKLAAILLDSQLNTAKESQDDDTAEGDVFDPNDYHSRDTTADSIDEIQKFD